MSNNPMESFLDRYPPPEDLDKPDGEGAGTARVAPDRMRVDAEIDLHGKSADQAEAELAAFVDAALERGDRKVLVVHGKGNHEGSNSALKTMVQRFFEQNPAVGATGYPRARQGGRGATWAILRQRSR